MCNYLFINALQNLLFCIPKAAVLHGKSVGFAMQKSRFRSAKAQLSLFKGIILTKQGLQYVFSMAEMWGYDCLMQVVKKEPPLQVNAMAENEQSIIVKGLQSSCFQ
ncbi:hypothetical protein [Prevotella intermedia]|uniref:hypothetical protein n=1 Tax=Prevotella intermedia TaxID=28131 RepID=UPI000BE71A2E|nr:hypothetical protein [Prevotella intermedia]PDP67374.1 hypothetical protein CLI70_11520 [Prevotella intermedia]